MEAHEQRGLTTGRGSCSNTCLTSPFVNHAETTHNTNQNKKNLYSLDKQQSKSVLKGFWESLPNTESQNGLGKKGP